MASNPHDALAVVQACEEQLGLCFSDKSLLLRALTHRSYLNEADLIYADNERLEFLGDAVLALIVAEWLYQRFPEQREGFLTAVRASLVRSEALAGYARRLGLGDFLLLGRGEHESGGRERDSILAAAFEALIGALYLDQGMAAVARFLWPLIEPLLADLRDGQVYKDARTRLQEWAQARLGATPVYTTVAASGPDHARQFTVEVRIRDEVFGVGSGPSKQQAAQEAAEAAWQKVAQFGEPET
jgi:ribonuclease-3